MLNVYGTVLFDTAVAIDKYCTIHLNVDVSDVCVSAYVCVSFNQVEVALQLYFRSPFHAPSNNLQLFVA